MGRLKPALGNLAGGTIIAPDLPNVKPINRLEALLVEENCETTVLGIGFANKYIAWFNIKYVNCNDCSGCSVFENYSSRKRTRPNSVQYFKIN